AAAEITYTGSSTINVELDSTSLSLVITGAGVDNETRTFSFGQNPTVSDMVNALNTVSGVSAKLIGSGSVDSYGIFVNSMVTSRLSTAPYRLYVPFGDSISVDDVREAVSALDVSVKEMGTDANRSFQIRAKVNKDDETSSQDLQSNILSALQSKFGADNVPVIRQDFVGSQWSSSLLTSSIWMAIGTIFLIWLYAAIRFKPALAFGAVVALLHDCLVMFAFITWFQLEFSTTTLAAILTIFGYSINATVVILDRLRFNIKNMESKNFIDILNKSLNDTLGRSIITTVTTLFAAISLWVFTTGSIRTFAIVLTIGLISGCYSSIFISSGFIALVRRNWNPDKERKGKARPRVAEPSV
ncbi:MAG: protein translocase subunit SecF, partial [Treponema sp.]|nr:protein translocase subunit SecF [Treponema sp.]